MREMQIHLERLLLKKSFPVQVNPNSTKNEIVGIIEGGLEVAIKSPADKNKANTELVKFLSRTLGKQVRIKTGLTSRKKIVSFIE